MRRLWGLAAAAAVALALSAGGAIAQEKIKAGVPPAYEIRGVAS